MVGDPAMVGRPGGQQKMAPPRRRIIGYIIGPIIGPGGGGSGSFPLLMHNQAPSHTREGP